jgi:trehalose 6-phosphate phosphatase
MRSILARGNRGVLERFAGSNVLLALDFDGTLAPIVSEPARAAMRPSTRRLLEGVARLYPCVVISGRARADVQGRLHGLGVAEVIGNHGIESRRAAARVHREVRRWRRALETSLAPLRGVRIEDKAFSVAVHYRQSREKRTVRAALRTAARSLGDVRLIPGKQVLNVLPAGAPHKGMALERVRAGLGCETAVYVGDDDTDEDVFALDRPARLLTIRVGRKARSKADYYLRRQTDIDALLRRLLTLRLR